MTRKLMLASAIAAALTGHPALALELGALRTESALNQPFQGEIDLGDIKPDEIDALRVSIAPPEAFEKAGIERYYSLTKLRFTPEATADGRTLVRVSSQDPVREPYLDFLVEAVWPTGRLVKGYTVLLDPPSQTERRAPNVRPARTASAVSGPDRGLPPVAGGSGAYIAAPGEGFPLYIGPVGGGEGLWSLARRHAAAGATDAQTAMALYRCNQGAFVRGDINRLIAGKTLVIPSRDELFALDAEEARRELQAALHGRPVQRAPITNVTPEALSRLRLVGAAPSAGAPAVTASQPRAAATDTPSSDVLLAIENSETARQETIELRNRIQELETQLADIQALLQVRNAELARAQAGESPGVDLVAAADSAGPQAPESSVDLAPVESFPTPEPEPGAEAGLKPEPDSAPGATPSDSAIGLVPVPTPTPVTSETPDEVVPAEPPPQASTEPAIRPAPVVAPPEPAPERPPSSTWHSLLLPLAGLAGVTALGILLFSLVTARRRRQDQSSGGDEPDSELVLDRPTGSESAVEPGSMSSTAEPSEAEAVSLAKTSAPTRAEPIQQTIIQSGASPNVLDHDEVIDRDEASDPILANLTDFDAETDEADVLSEADIYIAYGRHREARELLSREIKRHPQRLDIKYKLAEALAAAGEVEPLRLLLDEIRSSAGDTREPAQWARMQHLLADIAPNAPLAPATPSLNPAAVAAAGALGLGGAAAAASAALESVTVPVLESAVTVDLESEDDLLLDLGDSEPAALVSVNDNVSRDSLPLEFDSVPEVPAVEEIAQAIEQDIDSILPLPEDFAGLDLDLGILGQTPPATESAPTAVETATDELALDLEAPLLEDGIGDLMFDGSSIEVTTPTPQIAPLSLDEPLDTTEQSLGAPDSGLSPEPESVPTDLLSSQWQIDSGIWDETATKLDLARAYMEMDDKEAAREILEEVIAEGRDEQRNEARAMLERLG